MANEQNLRPCEYKLSREEAKKGGINSGKARRQRKLMKEIAEIILSMPLEKGKLADIESIKNLEALKEKNITVEEAIILAQVHKALEGNTPAATFIRDTAGEKPSKDDWDGLGEDDI